MRWTDWQKKHSKKTQKQWLHQAQLRTSSQHFSSCLEVFKSKLWDAGVPPIIGPHKEPGLLPMSPRYISSPSLLPGVRHPYEQERRNFQCVPISPQPSLTHRCLLYVWPWAGPWEDSHSLPQSRFSLMFPGLWRILLGKTRGEICGQLYICCDSD